MSSRAKRNDDSSEAIGVKNVCCLCSGFFTRGHYLSVALQQVRTYVCMVCRSFQADLVWFSRPCWQQKIKNHGLALGITHNFSSPVRGSKLLLHLLLRTSLKMQTPPSHTVIVPDIRPAWNRDHVPLPPAPPSIQYPYGAQSIYIPLVHQNLGLISFGFLSLQCTL